MNIGRLIRYYRELMGLRQYELAERIFVTDKTIGHYETGARIPSVDKLEMIAKALGIEVAAFFQEDETMFEELTYIEKSEEVVAIKESTNILAIRKEIEALGNRKKLIVVVKEVTDFVKMIMTKYYGFRKYIYFCYGIERFQHIRKNLHLLEETDFRANDKAVCIYNIDNIFNITESVTYTIVGEKMFEEGDIPCPLVEIITCNGFYGSFPKEWFELYDQGDTTKPVPKAPIIDRMDMLYRMRRFM